MTATLSERYISAVIESLPPASRDDVEAELTVSIAEAIQSRSAQGEDRMDAEKSVLNNLGDPDALAAGYADRPLHLIGPRYYLTWWRLLKLLWAIVPVTAMGAVAIGQILAESSLGEIFASSISVGISVFLHVTFWVTLVFVVMERTGNSDVLSDWSVERLPEIRPKGPGRSDMIASLVFLAAGIAAVLWDQLRGFVIVKGVAYPFLNPEMWPWWIPGLFAIMAAQTALVVTIYRSGSWNAIFAVLNSVIAVVFATTATALLVNGELVNPRFVTAVFTDNGVDADTLHTLALITGIGIIGFSAWGIIDGWWKTVRDSRGGRARG